MTNSNVHTAFVRMCQISKLQQSDNTSLINAESGVRHIYRAIRTYRQGYRLNSYLWTRNLVVC